LKEGRADLKFEAQKKRGPSLNGRFPVRTDREPVVVRRGERKHLVT